MNIDATKSTATITLVLPNGKQFEVKTTYPGELQEEQITELRQLIGQAEHLQFDGRFTDAPSDVKLQTVVLWGATLANSYLVVTRR